MRRALCAAPTRHAVCAVVAATALALSGCAADLSDAEIDDGVTPEDNSGSGDDDGAVDDPEASQVPGGGASPAPGECIEVPEAPDGFYTVGDAGTLVLAVEDQHLTLGAISPAGGWEHEVESEEGEEVEVTFRNESSRIDFEAEFEDGEIKIEMCSR